MRRRSAGFRLLLILLTLVVAFGTSFAEEPAKEEEQKETEQQIARVKRLEKMLGSRNKLEMVNALKLLGQMQTRSATDVLMKYVKKSKNAEHATYAVNALGWSGNKRAVDFLCGTCGLKSKKLLVAEAACGALRTIGDRRAVPALIEAIRKSKVVVVRAAITAVVELDPKAKGLAKLMVKQAKHKSPFVRMSVASAMGSLTDKSVVEPLIKLASRDGNSLVRQNACRSLGQLAPPEALEALEKIVKTDKSSDVRSAAIQALENVRAAAEKG
jgi:HEAT repeat protein